MAVRKMKVWVLLASVFSICLYGTLAAQDEADGEKKQDKEISWFDMKHCEICNSFDPMKHSMHRIKWDNHLLDNGMISVSVVPEDMKEDMAKAQANMQNAIAKLAQGEQLDMCGHCLFMGKMMEMGAKFEQIESVGVDITIVTSSDPEVVEQIHKFAEQSKKEYARVLEELEKEKDN